MKKLTEKQKVRAERIARSMEFSDKDIEKLWELSKETFSLGIVSEKIQKEIEELEKNKKKYVKELDRLYDETENIEKQEYSLLDKSHVIIKPRIVSRVEETLIYNSFGLDELTWLDHCEDCNCKDRE